MESGRISHIDALSLSENTGIPLEVRVRSFTRVLSAHIDELRSLTKPRFSIKDMERSILSFVNDIQRELKDKNILFDIDNVYYNYFLLKVCQYNSLFFHVVDAAKSLETTPLVSFLESLKAEPVFHPYVEVSYNTRLMYKRAAAHKAPGFREHIRKAHKDGVTRNYYNEKDAEENYNKTGDTFEAYYRKANLSIGFGTQKSNVFALFRSVVGETQGAENFWRPRDKEAQKIEKRLYRSAKVKLSQGVGLTDEEMKAYTAGQFHCSTGSSLNHFPRQKKGELARHFHVGHAAQDIDMGNVVVSVDPVYYNSYSATYKRHTEAGKLTKDCFAHIICYTHNHYDHMDEQTAKEAFTGLDPLFIVPAGDAALLKSWGFKNVLEISSWNDVIEVEVFDYKKAKKETLTIYGLPAKHASNRVISPTMPDINVSFYTGFMFHREGADHITLVTGDTAVLDDEHINQLRAFLIKNNFTVSSACIASGPDRPRSLMECTHQSTADAIVFHAKLMLANALVVAKRANKDLNFEHLLAKSCRSIGYHQGCFRLGLLSHNDVEGTITRILAAVRHCVGKQSIEKTLNYFKEQQQAIEQLSMGLGGEKNRGTITNFPFVAMDHFERVGVIALLEVFAAEPIFKRLTLASLNAIVRNFFLPRPGELLDFNDSTDKLILKSFKYNYDRLIVNRDSTGKTEHAYEYVLRHIERDFLDLLESREVDERRNRKIVNFLFKIYQEKTSYKMHDKKEVLKKYLASLARMNENDVVASLALLQGDIKDWKTTDEVVRDEGQFETLILIAYGVLTDQDFRAKFISDLKKARPEFTAAHASQAVPPRLSLLPPPRPAAPAPNTPRPPGQSIPPSIEQ